MEKLTAASRIFPLLFTAMPDIVIGKEVKIEGWEEQRLPQQECLLTKAGIHQQSPELAWLVMSTGIDAYGRVNLYITDLCPTTRLPELSLEPYKAYVKGQDFVLIFRQRERTTYGGKTAIWCALVQLTEEEGLKVIEISAIEA